MLALNEPLQRAGKCLETRFCQVKYLPSGAVSTILTKKANAGTVISRLSNVLIQVAKTVDLAIVKVEILEHWQRPKIYGILLEMYLKRSMELLKCKVESSTVIQLKAFSRWLINKYRLRKQQETGNKRGFDIIITV